VETTAAVGAATAVVEAATAVVAVADTDPSGRN
jgi:hypothetical protein